MKILIIHAIDPMTPPRRTTFNQCFCLPKYADGHDYLLHFAGHSVTKAMCSPDIDVIILDTTFLCFRWIRPRSEFANIQKKYAFVAHARALKIAFPQDDYDHAAILDGWLEAWGVHLVFSPLAQFAELLYPRTRLTAEIVPCVTGHVDDLDLLMLEDFRRPFDERVIDVGYRARELSPLFGRLGRLKSEIGRRFVAAIGGRALTLDISTRAEHVFAGPDWLNFLGNCRFFLGSPSGSSLIDFHGEIKDKYLAYYEEHPEANFEQVEAACFPGLDNQHRMAALGPRNLEAAAARVCQILVEDPCFAPMEANVHYISLAADCGNISDVMRQVDDRGATLAMVEACYDLLVGSGTYSHRRFVARIFSVVERKLTEIGRPYNSAPLHLVHARALVAREQKIIADLFEGAVTHIREAHDQSAAELTVAQRRASDTERQLVLERQQMAALLAGFREDRERGAAEVAAAQRRASDTERQLVLERQQMAALLAGFREDRERGAAEVAAAQRRASDTERQLVLERQQMAALLAGFREDRERGAAEVAAAQRRASDTERQLVLERQQMAALLAGFREDRERGAAEVAAAQRQLDGARQQLARVLQERAGTLAELAAVQDERTTIQRGLELRRGWSGALREILRVNDIIDMDGSPKPQQTMLPFRAKLYFALRGTAVVRGLRIAHVARRRYRDRSVFPDKQNEQVSREAAGTPELDDRIDASLPVPVAEQRVEPPVEQAPPEAVGAPPPGDRIDASPPVFFNKLREPVPPDALTMLVPDDRIDRRVLLTGRSLQRAGWNVTVIAVPHPDPVDQDQIAFPELSIIRVNTSDEVPNPLPAAIGEDRCARDWKAVYFYHNSFLSLALQHPARIYVAHDLPVLAAAAAAAKRLDSILVYDAHELYPEQHHFGTERAAFYIDAEATLIKHADLVTTINESIAREMSARYGIPIPQVILNAPAGEEKVQSNGRNELRDDLGIPTDKRILLFQGSLSLNRNLEDLVTAMKQVRRTDVVLVLMGPGTDKRLELEEIARQNNTLGRRVFFHNAVPQNVLLRFTSCAEVGIVPYPPIDLNSQYCTPNKLFEFIVAGLPILANDLPELRRFVHDTGFGQVHQLDGPRKIARAIDRMFGSDLEVYHRHLAARRQEFIWDVQGEKIISLYNALTEKHAPTTGERA